MVKEIDKIIKDIKELLKKANVNIHITESELAVLVKELTYVDKNTVTSVSGLLDLIISFNVLIESEIESISVDKDFEDIAAEFNQIIKELESSVKKVEIKSEGRLINMADIQANLPSVMKGPFKSVRSFFGSKKIQETPLQRFNTINSRFSDVCQKTKTSMDKEELIIRAYSLFREGLELVYNLLQTAHDLVISKKNELEVKKTTITEQAKIIQLDREIFQLEKEENALMGIVDAIFHAKSIGDLCGIKIMETYKYKRDLHTRAVSYYTVNRGTMSMLAATVTSIASLSNATSAMEAMKAGTSKTVQTIANVSGKVQERAIAATYGSMVDKDVILGFIAKTREFETRSLELIAQHKNSASIARTEIMRGIEDMSSRTRHALITYNNTQDKN